MSNDFNGQPFTDYSLTLHRRIRLVIGGIFDYLRGETKGVFEMPVEMILDGVSGDFIPMHAQEDFMVRCAGYWHDRTYRNFLGLQRAKGLSPEQAIAELRGKLGAVTKAEKAAAWEAKQAAWATARAAKRPVGRPSKVLTVEALRARIAAVLMVELAKIEGKAMTADAKALADSVKRQVLGG